MDLTAVANHAQSIRHNIIDMIHEAEVAIRVDRFLQPILWQHSISEVLSNTTLLIPTILIADRVIMSKGHAAPALYATLAEAGYIAKEELKTLRKLGTRLQGHPDSNLVPGVEVSTGSLGQGLSIAAGLAAGLKLDKSSHHVYAVLGDGECEEGQVWEAATFAAFNELNNLIAIVDQNGLQIDGPVMEVCEVGSLCDKFKAFGWDVHEVDGHDLQALITTLQACKDTTSTKPQVVIAATIKGKGVSFMENQAGGTARLLM